MLVDFIMIKPSKEISSVLQNASSVYKVPFNLLKAVAYTESRYNPTAVSPVGAKGLMQIMPINFESYGITDPFDPVQSANAGAKMLAKLKDKYGNWSQALAAYNWGPGNVNKKPNFEQWPNNTQKYVSGILELSGIESEKKNPWIIPLLFALTSMYLLKKVANK